MKGFILFNLSKFGKLKNCLRFHMECVRLVTVKYRHVTGNAGRTFYDRKFIPSVFGSAFFI